MESKFYKILDNDENFQFNEKVNCYAINYITHQIVVCDKETIKIFCLDQNKVLKTVKF